MSQHHTALVHTMVLVSAADRDMTDAELKTIGEIVSHLPVFADYDLEKLPKEAQACAELISEDNGLEKVLSQIVAGLPEKLKETAYAVALDVAAADGKASQEELRLLEMLRHRLAVGRLPAAAIERGARARYTRL
ncbi:tellurite resistance TerB family protein [Pelagibius sp. CAU 1746]|uniref:tellurite resistance TerB family protein n=1 Tax=Pelagibius sp. CAU 1746 TaxID=3140370 RepID=UPI00325AE011